MFCPRCGKDNHDDNKFCKECGERLLEQTPLALSSNVKQSVQPANFTPPVNEEKNPFLALICSLFIPGLGQVYDGLTARGIAIFLGTIVGLVIYIIPGVFVWLYGMYDAYSMAKKMNDQEIPFMPTNTAHLILFFIIVGIVFFLFIIWVTLTIFAIMANSIMPK
jgi:TM2 domain-containing membrane protein YozV